jgi:endoglucanase
MPNLATKNGVIAAFTIVVYLHMTLPGHFAAQAADDVYVRVNQLGYRPGDVKVAIAMAHTALSGKLQVVEASTQKTAFESEVRSNEVTWGKFDHHVHLDFSRFDKQGEYFVRIGDSKSTKFRISTSAYADLPDQLLEFMRQQRCGYNPWVDSVCHSFDGRTVDGPLPAGSYVDARGGWHDAGDQLKYLLTSSNATAQLLLAYQMGRGASPQAVFGDRVNALGQPVPNGIADLLDEARWGLDWMLRLHPAPDQLYHQVADDRDHSIGFRQPQNETIDYGWGKGSYRPVYSADGKPQGLMEYKSESNGVANLAGRYAAAMGLCYQIWKGDARMRPYAERCLTAGKEVYATGKAREGVQQGNSYKAPYRYAETTWADDMEWGAAELFRATGESKYRTDALRYAELAGTDGWFGKATAGHYQYYPFMNLGHYRLYDLVNEEIRERLLGYYRSEIESCKKSSADNPYGIGVPFIWCSNNLTVALATQCALYRRMTGDSRYRGFSANHRDWLGGRNPWGFSMFTEIPTGGRFPRDVHLFGTAVFKRSIRGGLVDGPVGRSIFGNLKGVSIREPDPLAEFQDERAVYHDDIHDYSTNEPTMDGTASAILMWVVLTSD